MRTTSPDAERAIRWATDTIVRQVRDSPNVQDLRLHARVERVVTQGVEELTEAVAAETVARLLADLAALPPSARRYMTQAEAFIRAWAARQGIARERERETA